MTLTSLQRIFSCQGRAGKCLCLSRYQNYNKSSTGYRYANERITQGWYNNPLGVQTVTAHCALHNPTGIFWDISHWVIAAYMWQKGYMKNKSFL